MAPMRSSSRSRSGRAPVRHAGAAARNGPRAAAGAAASSKGRTGPSSCCPAMRRCSRVDSLKALLATHCRSRGRRHRHHRDASNGPFGYGRIVRTNGKISKIVEERDATAAQKAHHRNQLRHLRVRSRPAVRRARHHRHREQAGRVLPARSRRDLPQAEARGGDLTVERADEIRGINSRTELAEVSTMVRQQKNEELMAAGVTLIDPATTYVDADVVVGARHGDLPVRLSRGLDQDRRGLRNPLRRAHRQLDDRRSRVCEEPHCGDGFHSRRRASSSARSRTSGLGSEVGEDVAHRQLRRAQEDRRWATARRRITSPISATRRSARKTNVGAGTITCNYDGEKKHQTVIGNERVRRQQQHARRAGHPG